MSCPVGASIEDRATRALLMVQRAACASSAEAFRSLNMLLPALREERVASEIEAMIIELELSRCWVVGCVGCPAAVK